MDSSFSSAGNFESRAPVRPGLPQSISIVLASAALLLLSPVLLAVGIAVRLTSPGPALFRQKRLGLHGHEFVLLKFRSMRSDASGSALTSRGDPRVTPLGRWLRRTKADELPQLWNVACGHMAIVGPRPEVRQHADLSQPIWDYVLSVRPGITDPVTLWLKDEESLLASVDGDKDEFYRRHLQPMKLRGYVSYIAARDAMTDVRIIWATFLTALGRPIEHCRSIDDLALMDTAAARFSRNRTPPV
jgi:lipopolysaccharide/colanic/teichoic acid biosynthesis glycosyltransferase